LVRSRGLESAVEDIARHRGSLTGVLWQSPAARPGTQPVLLHEPFDTMKAAGETLGQHVVPDTASSVGSVAALEAAIDRRHQNLIVPGASAGAAVEPGMEARAGDIQRLAQPCHRPDVPVLRDESEPHIASLAKKAAAFFRMSRSAFSFATSLRSRSISCCSGFICPWPGKACCGSPPASRTHLRSTFSWRSRSRAACATETPRSFTSLTASSLNSRLNFRLCIPTLQFRQTPYLGVHETGSRPASTRSTRGAGSSRSHPEAMGIRRQRYVV